MRFLEIRCKSKKETWFIKQLCKHVSCESNNSSDEWIRIGAKRACAERPIQITTGHLRTPSPVCNLIAEICPSQPIPHNLEDPWVHAELRPLSLHCTQKPGMHSLNASEMSNNCAFQAQVVVLWLLLYCTELWLYMQSSFTLTSMSIMPTLYCSERIVNCST